ncbi:hypothetical protein SDC9_133365 [bioreactor metagenome]|uniref:Uncharacterized protein n=1 Tax=bioreactor metagenome TaxID=1076179 RepID=A0A645DA31_9ZZZZ
MQCLSLASQRITALVTVNTERANAEFHPRFELTNGLVYLFNQQIDITSAPIGPAVESTSVTCKAGVVGEIQSFNGVRIKIIVHVNGIYIITGNNIGYHHADVMSAFRQGRIEKELIAVSDEPFGMDIIHMTGC